MKHYIPLLTLLLLSSCNHGEKLHERSSKRVLFDTQAEQIIEINKGLLRNLEITEEQYGCFSEAHHSLQEMIDEIILITGGLNEYGDVKNLPSISATKQYFYAENYLRPNAYTYYFETMDKFIWRYNELYPENSFEENFNRRLERLKEVYQIDAMHLFYDVPADLAIDIIESSRELIAQEQTKYFIHLTQWTKYTQV